MRLFLGFLFFGIVAIVAGTLGFQAGVASSVAAGTGGVPPIVYLGGGFHFGGFLFFFLFFLLFVGLILFGFGARRRYWAGHDAMGRGPWYGGPGPMGDGDPRRQWIADAHRRLHEEEAARAAGTAGTSDGATGGTPTTS